MSKVRIGNTGIVRVVLIFVFMVIQAAALVLTLHWFRNYFIYLYAVCFLLTVVVVLYIISGTKNPAYKIAWLIPVMLLPIFGGLFYLLFGKTWLSGKEQARMADLTERFYATMNAWPGGAAQLSALDEDAAVHSRYLVQATGTYPFSGTAGEFLASGEIMYQRMLEELAQAENFIFLEFFIIENGRMWQPMLEILEQKAQAGVDVRVIYDDYGSLMTLPSNYDKLLEKKGIKCRVYNRFKARLSSQFNTRDHRKICVVDGDKGFVGGINLADEYINLKNVYGHWHDCGLFVAGQAVAALSAQFLTMWSLVHGSDEDYQPFLAPALVQTPAACAGFFQPYTDNPLDEENVGESVYLNIINRARNYVYISSPFLVIDNELIVALTTAAKSGVDVRIITPRVGAAAMSYVSRSYYEQLIRAGLHIYEYLPGYIHSKTYVCDDRFAVVGSINMDYRSLYLSHENAVWICDSPVVNTIRDDYDKLLAQSIEITLADCHRISGIKRLLQAILRLFSPLA